MGVAGDKGETRARKDSVTGGFLRENVYFTSNTTHTKDEALSQAIIKD